MWEAKRRLGIARPEARRHAAVPSLPPFLLNFHAPLIAVSPAHFFPLLFSVLFIVPFLSISAMDTFTHKRTFRIHDEQSIDVVYTNDLAEVTRNLDMFESLLEGVEDMFMGLDLEYTKEDLNHEVPQEVAVVQLALDKQVLVFQYSRYVKNPDIIICC